MIELPEDIDIILTDAGQLEKICADAELILVEARGDFFAQSKAIEDICKSFFEINNPASADLFFKYVSKKFKITKKIFLP